jgi:hypothetical protein
MREWQGSAGTITDEIVKKRGKSVNAFLAKKTPSCNERRVLSVIHAPPSFPAQYFKRAIKILTKLPS